MKTNPVGIFLHYSLLLVIITFVTGLQSAYSQEAGKEYFLTCVGFYNIENLFDTIDSPDTRDTEFTPGGSAAWTGERYTKKLTDLAGVIYSIGTDINPDGVAILGLSEMENRDVLEDLVKEPLLSERNYQVIHFDSPDERGVDVGMIYQPKYFEPVSEKSYYLGIEGMDDFKTRDQLVVSGILGNETIHLIVNHWPSRRGGEKRSQPLRMAAAKLNRHIIDSLLSKDKNAKIIVMGDLNDNPTDKSVKTCLRSSGNSEHLRNGELFNPMVGLYKKGIGSNAWRDTWSLFDQILVSPGLTGSDLSSLKLFKTLVFNKKSMAQKEGRYKGYPYRTYAGGVYLGGYSDHFPVYIYLIKELN